MASLPQLLKDKVAIVTGADSVIGKEIAIKFVNHGATVIVAVAGKDVKSCEGIQHEINGNSLKPKGTTGKAIAMHPDGVRNWASFSNEIIKVQIKYSHLDIFYYHAEFFNCGFYDAGSGPSMEDNVVKSVLDLVGTEMGKNNPKGGCILYGNSTMGMRGDAMPSAYGISQTAATGVVPAMAAELATQNVRVNAISQGILDFRVLRPIFPRASNKQLQDMSDDWMMIKAEADDVADTAVFLASNYGRSVTGHNLQLNGASKL